MGRVIIFTGAGISAESGIPTYRDKQGLWDEYDTAILCDYFTWQNHVDKVHEFYNKRRQELYALENGERKIKANIAHIMVDKWIKKYNGLLITQNVDDLHEQAGSSALHLHGRMKDLTCVDCYRTWEHGPIDYKGSECIYCGSSHVKPGVVFFNEYAPNYLKLGKILNNLQEDDVIVVIGTCGSVVPIDMMLGDKPGYKILNNLEPKKLDNGSYAPMNGLNNVWNEVLYGPCTEQVSKIDYRLRDIFGS